MRAEEAELLLECATRLHFPMPDNLNNAVFSLSSEFLWWRRNVPHGYWGCELIMPSGGGSGSNMEGRRSWFIYKCSIKLLIMGCSSGVDWMENGISSAGVLAYIWDESHLWGCKMTWMQNFLFLPQQINCEEQPQSDLFNHGAVVGSGSCSDVSCRSRNPTGNPPSH